MGFNYWQNIEEGGVYHLYNKAVSDLVLFREEKDYLFFVTKYQKYFNNYFDTFAYCLIPNHFHFMIRVKANEEIKDAVKKENSAAAIKYLNGESSFNHFISDQFRRFFSSFAIKYNNKYHHEGAVFRKRIKKVRVSTDGSIQRLLCYIHHNPIHHKLTEEYSHWNYSSYNDYFDNAKIIIAKKWMINWLGNKSIFNEIHKNFKLENIEIEKNKYLFE
jgi:REP element-mobilizing transposase RayT